MIHSVDSANFNGKRVLVRVDFNVPINEERKITDDNRIIESLPTIDKIIDDGGIPVVMSHLGRPKGERNEKYSLRPVADYLRDTLGYQVLFAEDCIGVPAESIVSKAIPGELVVLENLRFHKEEEKNDPEFAKQLAELGEVYVDDAFGSAHRAHASIDALARLFTERYAGRLLMDEIKYLELAIKNPRRPFLSILGGAKISDKINVINNLLDKCDSIIIGGGMAFTFLKAKGYNIGDSICEEDKVELAGELIQKAKEQYVNLFLPVDVRIVAEIKEGAEIKVVKADEIPSDWKGIDIGPETEQVFADAIGKAGTVIWNGPMGIFEIKDFAHGTFFIAKLLADLTDKGSTTIIGGGDTAAAIKQLGLQYNITHLSTGGGASLEYLEGKILPGIAVLDI